MAKFTVYKDAKGEYRWRLLAKNSKIVADSGEGYKTKASCLRGIEILKTEGPAAEVHDETSAAAANGATAKK
ncbi:hypothetical protein OJF2_38740 [Aquisphaera giovannonii]|uniref:DUF1508 domain-containing protein n=1 Tax=Aquisphaera giovannonii TaxID=406548 RepID=A0A5B9W3Y4_9BACT|nr:DUF1508 domain-containing protein [Aquisphaera giovannonii]QEH35323.1 hypothetical protein OJF2_38740 [Aquisphaera giovannonii]